jgi:hypothetical protein
MFRVPFRNCHHICASTANVICKSGDISGKLGSDIHENIGLFKVSSNAIFYYVILYFSRALYTTAHRLESDSSKDN